MAGSGQFIEDVSHIPGGSQGAEGNRGGRQLASDNLLLSGRILYQRNQCYCKKCFL